MTPSTAKPSLPVTLPPLAAVSHDDDVTLPSKSSPESSALAIVAAHLAAQLAAVRRLDAILTKLEGLAIEYEGRAKVAAGVSRTLLVEFAAKVREALKE